jgi:hypothetical protein
LDYQADFQEYLNYHINNVGDPFISGNLTINIMAHVTPELIDRLIADLSQPEAFPPLEEAVPSVSERMVASGAKDLVYAPHTGRGFR